ncbi:class I SAM-dependent methyltransferase [Natrinema halophilum]|uniref:Class I SAM-dependent methyltransferase n=1 Tax=Natrinema halophilum TaxID=1699371 RepID=A0A7D5KRX3_9EURY|nr:class I SAM-dependent methyltransferase [Natrinema halophilum]QLG48884.1 class I SAM-dependent methyltransferase [Natrinema halophilum]
MIDDIRVYSDKFDIAVDISSSHFANAEYFCSDQYVGVDIDRDRLRQGKADFATDPNYTAIHADIHRPIFQKDSIGMIVSTHTFSHLAPDDRLPVLELFLDYLTPGGCLLLQLANDAPTAAIASRLQESFDTVQRTDYYNEFTRSYRRLHNGDDPTMAGWQRYPNAAIIVILSFLEALSWPNPTYTYSKCLNKQPE